MDSNTLQDMISRGLGTAARVLGGPTDAYRPVQASSPLAPENRYLRLPAAFSAPDGRFRQPDPYGAALWHGVFDAAYTLPGDYLVQGSQTFFIAAQQPLLPVLCVKANRIVSFARAAAPTAAGANAYGGFIEATASPLMTGWPANVLGLGGRGKPEADLPGDESIPLWTVLMPAWPGVYLRPADLMTDDLGRNSVVAAAELSELGWRLTVRQAIT